jgi:hypothetical protein
MIADSDAKLDRDSVESISSARQKTDGPQQPFLRPWRLKTDTRQPVEQQDESVGCGSGPIV